MTTAAVTQTAEAPIALLVTAADMRIVAAALADADGG